MDSTPACYSFEGSSKAPDSQHIFYVGTDDLVHGLKWDGNGGYYGWHYDDEFDTVGAPPAFSDVVAFADVEAGTHNVFYVSQDHDIIEVQWTP